ncbi:zinc finger protein Gfi-1-like [Platysternon megacephalum]|uniref:Zinc finger protein Gfi-1-like n=1 Tax=Platysternon megacephalum TaxID=55544 RepID=A0A4D9DNI0_9SAUR|nr:zinc finger protein Gfi-1-like [Platysternon megacephalum]
MIPGGWPTSQSPLTCISTGLAPAPPAQLSALCCLLPPCFLYKKRDEAATCSSPEQEPAECKLTPAWNSGPAVWGGAEGTASIRHCRAMVTPGTPPPRLEMECCN